MYKPAYALARTWGGLFAESWAALGAEVTSAFAYFGTLGQNDLGVCLRLTGHYSEYACIAETYIVSGSFTFPGNEKNFTLN